MRTAGAIVLAVAVMAQTPAGPTDAALTAASQSRTVRVGSPATGRIAVVPIELYVARVLAGEGEPRAADAAQEALAVAIRTYVLANQGRHRRDGYALCDTTHCQVLRQATPASRRAALATAGRVLLQGGRPAELFYSASCGGQSESAAALWPAANLPYLRSEIDDVHGEDVPWRLTLELEEIGRALARAGFQGQLTDIGVEERTESGRAGRLRLEGMRPDVIGGDPLRGALGFMTLRSTAFSIEREGTSVTFVGRGFGHGVGMCVIGAGRRALRGETVEAILGHYYPGLTLTGGGALPGARTPEVVEAARTIPTGRIVARVPAGSAVSAVELERTTQAAYEDLARALGTSVAPIAVELHESIESFRQATGRPWWFSAAVSGTGIDLAPAAVLAEREGLGRAVRTAVAELLVSGEFAGRPAWVRVGAARYFGRSTPADAPPLDAGTCPADAELELALSVVTQREAEIRAEACFARAFALAGDWRLVR